MPREPGAAQGFARIERTLEIGAEETQAPDGLGEDGSSLDPEWASFSRVSWPFAKTVSTSPASIDARELDRHPELNVGDVYILKQSRVLLATLVELEGGKTAR